MQMMNDDEETDTPAEWDIRNDPRHTTPFALPIECLDLTPQQIDFCEEYLVSSNATLAATKAGYSENSAQEQGSRLLSHDMVQTYLRARIAQRVQTKAVNLEFLQSELLDTYRKAKEGVPIFNKKGKFTGRYQFDGRTAVAALAMLAKLGGFIDKEKDDGRAQRPFQISIILGQHNPEAAKRVADHYGLPMPHPEARPKVEGFPRVQFTRPNPNTDIDA